MILLNVLYTAFWEDEKYWHWTHDIEVLKVIIPFFGTLLTGIITFVGILFAAKTTRESLNNIKESTPPELLRLATWSKIIQESQDYQANVSTYYSNYSNRLISTYHDILIRATLEKDISDLGVIDSEVRKELLLLKPKSIKNEYPRIVWRIRYNKKLFKYIIVLAVLSIYFLISALINLQIGNMYAIIIFTALFLFVLLCIIKLFHKHNNLKMIKNIIFRNACHALESIYKIPGYTLHEDANLYYERKDFEDTKEFKKWKDRVQEDNSRCKLWTSWNYGLSINWDNNPYKNSTNKDITKDLELNYFPPNLFQSKNTPSSNTIPKFSDAKLPPKSDDD